MTKYLDETGVKFMWQKTKAYVDQASSSIENKISTVYRFKGSVENLEALKVLPEGSLQIGDVYNVKTSGMNYAWTGEKENPDYEAGWDPLGGIVEIPTLTIEEIDRLLTGD